MCRPVCVLGHLVPESTDFCGHFWNNEMLSESTGYRLR